MTWRDLRPEPFVTDAMREADVSAGVLLDDLFQHERHGAQTQKKNWTKAFADKMARKIAVRLDNVKSEAEFKGRFNRFLVSPVGQERNEPFVALGDGEKQIDVLVRHPVSGMQISISLKSACFPDKWQEPWVPLNFGKNLTGRLYELFDETIAVHRNLPRCSVIAVYYFPLEAVYDKDPSTLYSISEKLINKTGRTNPYDPSEFVNVDLTFVGLFANREYGPTSSLAGVPRGVMRFFPLEEHLPPRRGLPRVQDTVDLNEMLTRILWSRIPEDRPILPAEEWR